MVNLRALKLKGKTICDCGHEFKANDITNLIKNNDYQYYGGRVECYSEIKCPDCKKDLVILLEPYNNSYRVIDVGTIIDVGISGDGIIIKEGIDNLETNEFVCDKCHRTFKSKSGLSIHQKSCKG